MDNEATAYALGLSEEVKYQLETGRGPLPHLMQQARTAAKSALAKLVIVETDDVRTLISAQNDVKRYRDLINWIGGIIEEGNFANRKIDDETREALLDEIRAPATNEEGYD